MAEFNKKTGEIELSQEDKQMFKDCGHNMSSNKRPWAENIMRAIIPRELHESFFIGK